MGQKDSWRLHLRLSYDNPDHLRIIDTLDDLNLAVYKSKNQFIVNALLHYMDSVNSDTLTYSAEQRKKDMEKSYVTKEYVDGLMEKMADRVKENLYEEMMRFFAGAAVSSGMGRAFPETVRELPPDKDGMDSSGDKKADDLTETLGQYDSVLSQVMSWSEE